jgi:hypothetical protein
MAVLSRVSFSSQQRLDLQHVIGEQSFQAADFRYFASIFGGIDKNYVVRGLEIISKGTLSVSVNVANCMIMSPLDGATSFYVGLPDDAPSSILLPQTSTIYLEAYFERATDNPVTTAQWDPGAITSQNPEGTEFTSSINFEEYVDLKLRYNTAGFTENAIKIATITTSANSVVGVVDARDLFYRLASGGAEPDYTYRFPWSDDRGESAEVGIPSYFGTMSEFNPYYTQDQVGVRNDKAITSLKQWMDAMMSIVAEVKGTPYWYSVVSQFVGKILFFDSINGSSCVPKAGLGLAWDPSARSLSSYGSGTVSWAFNAGALKWNLGGTFVTGTRLYNDELFSLSLPSSPTNAVVMLQMERETLPATADDVSVDWFQSAPDSYETSRFVTGTTNAFTGVAVGDYVRKFTGSFFDYIKVVGLYDGTTVNTTDGAIATLSTVGLYVEENSLTPSREKYRWFRSNYSQDDLYYTSTDGTFFTNGSLVLPGDTPDLYFLGRRNGDSFDWRTDVLPGRKDMLVGLNETGGGLARGTVVTLDSARRFIIGSAVDVASCEGTVGVVFADIADGAYGYAQVDGEAFVLTTTPLVPGGETYLSPVSPGYVQPTPSMVTGQADFLMGPAVSEDRVLLRMCLRGAVGNVYDEPVVVVSGAPADDNEITGPVAIDTEITLPFDSRNFENARFYPYGSGLLQVFLNGQLLDTGNDYVEVGPGPTSNKIQIKIPLVVDDELTFRIDLTSTAYFSTAASGSSDVTNGQNLGTVSDGEAVFASKVGTILQYRRIKAGTGCTVTASSTSLTIDVTGGGVEAGEVNTASNLGIGSGIFAQKSGVDLQFKSLIAGTAISITPSGTGLTISSTGEANSAASLGSGSSLVGAKLGTTLQFKSLVAGSGVVLASDANSVTISTTGGSAGEANTASNLGIGSGIFAQKSGVDLQFKSLIAGTNVSLTATSTAITINATGGSGETNTASNLGATGQGVFAQKSGVDLQFKKLIAGTNVTMSADASSITINATGGSGETNTASNLGAGTGIFASKVGVDLRFKSLVAGSGVSLANDANTVTITATGGGSGEALYKRVITSGDNMATLYAFGLLADVNAITIAIGGNTADISNITGTAKLHSCMIYWKQLSGTSTEVTWPDPNGATVMAGCVIPIVQKIDAAETIMSTAAGQFTFVSGTTVKVTSTSFVNTQEARVKLVW